MKYFFIGERELLLAFSLVGVDGAAVASRNDALIAFNKAIGKGSAVVGAPTTFQEIKVLILTEEVVDMLEAEVLTQQMSGNYPLVVEIPGLRGHLDGRKTLTESIREAIGIHV